MKLKHDYFHKHHKSIEQYSSNLNFSFFPLPLPTPLLSLSQLQLWSRLQVYWRLQGLMFMLSQVANCHLSLCSCCPK